MNPELSEKSITEWRKRLQFRAWHRGTREADLIMGPFAEREVPAMAAPELGKFENLLHCNDPDVYDWLTGKAAVPPEHDNLIHRLKEFEYQRGR
jgi:antitoxin CptB